VAVLQVDQAVMVMKATWFLMKRSKAEALLLAEAHQVPVQQAKLKVTNQMKRKMMTKILQNLLLKATRKQKSKFDVKQLQVNHNLLSILCFIT